MWRGKIWFSVRTLTLVALVYVLVVVDAEELKRGVQPIAVGAADQTRVGLCHGHGQDGLTKVGARRGKFYYQRYVGSVVFG